MFIYTFHFVLLSSYFSTEFNFKRSDWMWYRKWGSAGGACGTWLQLKTLCLSCYSTHVVIVIIFHMAAIPIATVQIYSNSTKHRPSSSSSSLLSSSCSSSCSGHDFHCISDSRSINIAIHWLCTVMRINSLKLIILFFCNRCWCFLTLWHTAAWCALYLSPTFSHCKIHFFSNSFKISCRPAGWLACFKAHWIEIPAKSCCQYNSQQQNEKSQMRLIHKME